ncbi:helix-turn-helix domain-containing protein [Rossellomorea vietnamensis]|uniref:Helix-turn-helix domain-containing protein n=1 Tax=Rossellomorea vietnamensis TaxID=218284 RepID=A0A5D4NTR9_9BACI|nr:helix-turn-helix domain-containing protein [Rossellomorea vietnamensis]TYS17607.1 helix-turn-helix domain-containing protein [Rossellomorea vietnamensis]
MTTNIKLNTALLRRRVPNLTSAAKAVGLRPATVSNLCTGKIPVGRAEVKTIVALASLANCTIDELLIRDSGLEMIESGIKVVDIFCPIVKGGKIGFIARAQMGQLVLLNELIIRLKDKGFQMIFVDENSTVPDVAEARAACDHVCQSTEEVFSLLKKMENKEDIILIADRAMVKSGELFAMNEEFERAGFPNITTFLYDPSGEAVDAEDPYGPLDSLIPFDLDLATRHMYPAVQPVQATSTLLEDALLGTNHLSIQRRARKLLRRYREIRVLVNNIGEERIPESEMDLYHRGQRLESFLTQPFYAAEAFTNLKGEYVPLEVSLAGVQKIIDGGADSISAEQLKYIGKL